MSLQWKSVRILSEFINQKLGAVYRYHLARSGDWMDAQAQTAETILQAWNWAVGESEPYADLNVWLFRIAVTRSPSMLKNKIEELAADPPQVELNFYALCADQAEQWRGLRSIEADTLALFWFSGLSPEEIGRVIGWPTERVRSVLDRQVPHQAENPLLSDGIQPPGRFVNWLEEQIQQVHPDRNSRVRAQLELQFSRVIYRIRPYARAWVRLLPFLLAAVLVFSGINLTQKQAADQLAAETHSTSSNNGHTELANIKDNVWLVDSAGRILVDDLASGKRTELTDKGFYPLEITDPEYLPLLSPDGKWLVVTLPGGKGTWLVSRDGARLVQLGLGPLRVIWSSDSRTMAHPDPQDARSVWLRDADGKNPRHLVDYEGNVTGLAWSPDGKQLAVLVDAPAKAAQKAVQTNSQIRLVDPFTGRDRHLADIADQEYVISRHPLLWTADSLELWYTPLRIAYRISDGVSLPIVAAPGENGFDLQSLLLGVSNPLWAQISSAEVSPERESLAVSYRNTDGKISILAKYDKDLSGPSRWIKNLGAVGRIAWIAEGKSLLVSQFRDLPGQLQLIDAAGGDARTLAENVTLLGTQTSLIQAGRAVAPEIKTSLLPTNMRIEGWAVVTHPEMGVTFLAPPDWLIWSFQSSGEGLILTNFEMNSMLGFTSLRDGRLWVSVSEYSQKPQNFKTSLESFAQDNPEKASFKEMTLDGFRVYWLKVQEAKDITYQTVWVEGKDRVILFNKLPSTSQFDPAFEQIIQSVHLLAQPTPIP